MGRKKNLNKMRFFLQIGNLHKCFLEPIELTLGAYPDESGRLGKYFLQHFFCYKKMS